MPAQTNAERQRAYRQRRKAAGLPEIRGDRPPRGPDKTQFERGQFIAIDGEGYNDGIEETHTATTGAIYKSRRHVYNMIAASDGSELISKAGRLTAPQCFDFLLDVSQRHKKGIMVCFGASFDVNHMIMYDLPRPKLLRLSKGARVLHSWNGKLYAIEYRKRKSLAVERYPEEKMRFRQVTIKGEKKFKRHPEATFTLWDVIGFFQSTFVDAMQKWLPPGYEHRGIIEKMKALRGQFDTVPLSEIVAYNRAELEALVAIMIALRDAVSEAGLVLKRWDGAGSVAAEYLKANSVKSYKPGPVAFASIDHEALKTAIATAYSGGRIEACKIGRHIGDIHHVDINSAYPNICRNLPCLAHGRWRHSKSIPADSRYYVARVRYHWPDMPFYPLFFRDDLHRIVYPARGEGWYWTPEVEAAQEFMARHGAIEFAIEEVYYFEQSSHCYCTPFAFIEDGYHLRQEYVKAGNAAEKALKLALNSVYGKLAQQLGGTIDRPPPYFQLDWAGYITSGTRAMLCRAAMQKPRAIISMATDGIFSLEKLDVDCPAEKILGAWEYKKHDEIVIVMPGIYWYRDGAEWKAFSRGFDKDFMRSPDGVLAAWRAGHQSMTVDTQRLIGMGTACTSDLLYELRGRFVIAPRRLDLSMAFSSKRHPISVIQERPHERLCDTRPRECLEYEVGAMAISAPYPSKLTEDYDEEKQEQAEVADVDNI